MITLIKKRFVDRTATLNLYCGCQSNAYTLDRTVE